jgi:nitrate reductase gamma subunit
VLSDGFVHFVEYELQIIALSWLCLLYVIKIFQLSRLPMLRENAPRKGSAVSGALRSYSSMFVPWSMESSKKHFWRWVEFGAYHVGAGIAILNTFTSPFAPGMMTEPVRWTFAILIAPALFLGLVKLTRRITRPEMRLISTPDDYFALASVEVYFFSAIMALMVNNPLWRTIYFLITAGFLFYVPFSKISHYIYFLFAAIFTGSRYGWRGVRPKVRRQAE